MDNGQWIMDNGQWKATFIALLFLIANNILAADTGADKKYFLVHDFQDEWQVYDNRQKSYVPYIDEWHNQLASHTVFFDIDNYRGYRLLFYSKEDNYLFINGSLRTKITAKTWLSMNIDSLYTVYKQPTIFLTLYGTKNLSDKKIQVGYLKEIGVKTTTSATLLTAKPRESSTSLHYLSIIGTFLLLFFSFLYLSYGRAVEYIYSLRQLFTFLVREQTFLVSRPLSVMNLSFVAFLAFLLSFMLVLLQSEGIEVLESNFFIAAGNSLYVYSRNFIVVAMLIFALFILKYYFIYFIGGIFSIEKAVNFYFFKVIQSSVLFFTLIASCLLWLSVAKPFEGINLFLFIYVPTILFYFVRVVLVFFTIKGNISTKNLYLFSYLCIVEIIPIVIGIRFAP